MNRIVLDTNVLVSGMINAHGAPGRIVDMVREEHVELVVDDRVLSEYGEVLRRPKFNRYFDLSAVRDIMLFLEQNTIYVVPVRSITGLPDPDDAPFAELALSAAVPLVTGNADHYPESLRHSIDVLTPAGYLLTLLPADQHAGGEGGADQRDCSGERLRQQLDPDPHA